MDLLSKTENSKVLDLGCGTGLLTKALGERVGPAGKVVGVDPDKARIQLAREKHGSSNVVFLEGSTDDFPEDQYDFVYSNYALHWVQEEAAFKNVYKTLSLVVNLQCKTVPFDNGSYLEYSLWKRSC